MRVNTDHKLHTSKDLQHATDPKSQVTIDPKSEVKQVEVAPISKDLQDAESNWYQEKWACDHVSMISHLPDGSVFPLEQW